MPSCCLSGFVKFLAQVLSGIGGIALGNLFGCSTRYELTATVAAFGTYVDKVVGTFDNLHIMLDDKDGVSARDECVERLHQSLDIVEVETRGGLIEDEEGGFGLLEAEVVGELHALVFTARKGG